VSQAGQPLGRTARTIVQGLFTICAHAGRRSVTTMVVLGIPAFGCLEAAFGLLFCARQTAHRGTFGA
jgi:hypothetical protein